MEKITTGNEKWSKARGETKSNGEFSPGMKRANTPAILAFARLWFRQGGPGHLP